MCGIFLYVTRDPSSVDNILRSLEPLLRNRGPNSFKKLTISLNLEGGELFLTFVGSVLWLRGASLSPQPFLDEEGNILLWNGDIFESEVLSGDESVSDTELLGHALKDMNEECFLKTMSELVGPYAFIHYRRQDGQLYFGRDFFGRQSLLMSSSSDDLLLSSVGNKTLPRLFEVPAAGIFSINLKKFFSAKTDHVTAHPWEGRVPTLGEHRVLIEKELKKNVTQLNVKIAANVCNRVFPDSIELPELCMIDNFKRNITNFMEVLSQSVKVRLEKMPKFCKKCIENYQSAKCMDAKVGILFSGGLDSTVLAALADRILPPDEPIDLLNVAFEQANYSFEVPDRLTAKQAFLELQAINPKRKYNLVLINVTKERLSEMRSLRISQLLHPLETVLDDSIGCAMWHAASGEGILYSNDDFPEEYKSPARVLLLGAGADEQLGGYSRHRGRFHQEGLPGLLCELKAEMDRISERNLGRDNRIVCDHGVTARYPYLDERVVSLLNSIPVYEKCDLTLKRGLGEKLLLRGMAFTLGLEKVALEPKRAIQFGTRIARMENRKEKATDKALRIE